MGECMDIEWVNPKLTIINHNKSICLVFWGRKKKKEPQKKNLRKPKKTF